MRNEDLAEEYRKIIYEWVRVNFGLAEADDPSWDIKALAKELAGEHHRIQEKIELEDLKEDIRYVAEEIMGEKLSRKQLKNVAEEYVYSDAYCCRDDDSIKYYIEKYKGEE